MEYFSEEGQLTANTKANLETNSLTSGDTDKSFVALKTTGAPILTEETINSVIESNEVVILLSYKDIDDKIDRYWYDEYVTTFDKIADQIKREFSRVGHIAFGKVNCELQSSLAERLNIPYCYQFAHIRNGVLLKIRYSLALDIGKLVEYVRKELEDPIREFQDITDLEELDLDKRMFIGFFNSKIDPEYDIFRKAASNYKYDCQFRTGFGEIYTKMHPLGKPGLVLCYNDVFSNKKEVTFTGSLQNYEEVNEWMSENYIPLVRKVGHLEYEDLIFEELPLLALLHKPEDRKIVIKFTCICESSFINLKKKVVFLTSDDAKCNCYLLNRSKNNTNNLPIIIFMTPYHFRFVFKDIQEIEIPGKLEEFLNDVNREAPIDNGEAPELTEETINETIASYEIVFIMFYNAKWDPISLEIVPWFNNAAQKLKEEFPQAGQVILAKVDGRTKVAISRRFGISEYPTFLVVRKGQCLRNRYKGGYTLKEVIEFIKQQWADWKYIEGFPETDDFPPLDPLI